MRFSARLALSGILLVANSFAGGGPSTFVEREGIAKLQAMDLFPDLEIAGSPLSRAVAAEVERLERTDPAFFSQAGWPVFIARRMAIRLGHKPRAVAEIRESIAKEYGSGSEVLRQLHGIQIVDATFGTDAESLDVTRELAMRVSSSGFEVDCDRSLIRKLASDCRPELRRDETDDDYWKRQRALLLAADDPRRLKAALRLTFEMHSERVLITLKDGERVHVSEDGEVTISAIPLLPGEMRGATPVANADTKRDERDDRSVSGNTKTGSAAAAGRR